MQGLNSTKPVGVRNEFLELAWARVKHHNNPTWARVNSEEPYISRVNLMKKHAWGRADVPIQPYLGHC